MPGAGAMALSSNIPSNEECGIRDVWAYNLDEEFKTIRQVVQTYHWIAMVCYSSSRNFMPVYMFP